MSCRRPCNDCANVGLPFLQFSDARRSKKIPDARKNGEDWRIRSPCAICLQPLSASVKGDARVEALIENERANRCNHIFHRTCLSKYVRTQQSSIGCPVCRTPIAEEVVVRLGGTFEERDRNTNRIIRMRDAYDEYFLEDGERLAVKDQVGFLLFSRDQVGQAIYSQPYNEDTENYYHLSLDNNAPVQIALTIKQSDQNTRSYYQIDGRKFKETYADGSMSYWSNGVRTLWIDVDGTTHSLVDGREIENFRRSVEEYSAWIDELYRTIRLEVIQALTRWPQLAIAGWE